MLLPSPWTGEGSFLRANARRKLGGGEAQPLPRSACIAQADRPLPQGEGESYLSSQRIQRLLEAAGMGLLRLCQGLEPIGDFLKAFGTRGLGHARIHVGIFVGLARDGGL